MMFPAHTGVVLIVDDTPQNIHVLMEALEDSCRVLAAKSGEEALRKVHEDKPDLILLDVMMPGMDGFEVCRRLKQNEAVKDIPVIFVTAVSDDIQEEKGLKLGAIDYIRKPFHVPTARVRIQNHLRLKRKSDLLEELVRIDGLTEIANRRGFDEALEREWRRCERQNAPLSLVMIDIDHFKAFNDTYGHAQGDNCLIRVARCIAQALNRPGDLAARYGGEEMAVLLPETPLEAASVMAETIRAEVEALAIANEGAGGTGRLTISLGAASMVPAGADATALVRQADAALYRAKAQGRNRVCFSGKDIRP